MTVTLDIIRTFSKNDLERVLNTKDDTSIKQYLEKYGLHIKDDKIYPTVESEKIWRIHQSNTDKLQLVRKILLNSAL